MGIIREPKNVDFVIGPVKNIKKVLLETDELIRSIKERKTKKGKPRKRAA